MKSSEKKLFSFQSCTTICNLNIPTIMLFGQNNLAKHRQKYKYRSARYSYTHVHVAFHHHHQLLFTFLFYIENSIKIFKTKKKLSLNLQSLFLFPPLQLLFSSSIPLFLHAIQPLIPSPFLSSTHSLSHPLLLFLNLVFFASHPKPLTLPMVPFEFLACSNRYRCVHHFLFPSISNSVYLDCATH